MSWIKSISKIQPGTKFGEWTVLFETDKRGKHRYWICRCSCGKEKPVCGESLVSGHSTKCLSCSVRNRSIKHNYAHRGKIHPLYIIWALIKTRCNNPKNKSYKNYGGRGIKICEEWRNNPKAFIEWALKHDWKKGLEIDRINNNGGYLPNNCRFVSRYVNATNKRKKSNTGYIGVHLSKFDNRYYAYIKYKGKRQHIGCFGTAIDAALARDKYITEHDFPHVLNFSGALNDVLA